MAAGDGTWREYDAVELPRVLQGALEAFAEQGYHGASIRELAARAGLSVPGLYHHHASKQDILRALLDAVLTDLLRRCTDALASTGDHPAERFDALVECLLRFHMFRTEHAFVATSELRSLTPANREHVVGLRDALQHLLDDVVEEGAADGTFTTPYPKAASRGVATLCLGVASWYRPDGPLSPDELVRRHLTLARGIVNGRD
ncbi:TetR family transcriptional regulator [Nocardioides sp. ChNu-153]|uniref:TetR/AcrR family transcriptional regulator n=1 Tax=unclassified Nocardioides TaxID=2615069 RepID=UPI0024068FA9|nr:MULTISPECIES: TetR/AcrR family transcriptional regulator [unclassified Nocardioides]MDF9714951.1 TetR/AcrR family transcriptional regulator [Nocardioides sp. ChNu-99]MDN7122452.1 TetR family transcriptional regulator [Nocardioides sp. ChNu-153]